MTDALPVQPRVVLIVDDDPRTLIALAVCLELAGYQAVQATDGESALGQYNERGGQVDFVMTTLQLPDLNGMELIAELRWQGSTVPMLVVTDSPVEEMIFQQQGADAVMTKPVDIAALLEWLGQEQGPDRRHV